MTALSYEVVAFNTAKESENRIHDDAVARRFGFTGGLVPGVDVYAYMTHPPVARWGRDWLEHGTAWCRFAKPVYDGNRATVTQADDGPSVALEVESDGVLCATGGATLGPAPEPPSLADWPAPPTPPATRPPADADSLPEGIWLGIPPLHVTPDFAAKYHDDVRETHPIYHRDHLIHPGLILRMCNWALTANVMLGPWIHVGSAVTNIAAGRVGETLSVRARVARNYAHKGHLFVDLDALVLADEHRPLARIAHTAIYRPRQVLEG